MKCSKCGAELAEGAKFCSSCGSETESQATYTAQPQVNDESQYAPIKGELPTQNFDGDKNEEKAYSNNTKSKFAVWWGKLNLYDRVSAISIVIFALMFLRALFAGRPFACIIAIMSVALTAVALLMRKKVIKAPNEWLHIVALVLAFVLTVPYFGAVRTKHKSSGSNTNATVDSFVTESTNDESDKTEPLTDEPSSTTEPPTTKATTEPTTTEGASEIVMTMSEKDFEGMDCKKAEKLFRKMGFTSFEYNIVKTDEKSEADKILFVKITEGIIGSDDFVEGDTFDTEAIVKFKYYEYEAPKPVYYSTNDYATARKGKSGVFSYKNKGGSYDIYWIVDFDDGYVYWFTEGNGDSTCDKVKIVSGDLNDRITVTWHDGGTKWSWRLHFKYKNSPTTLVVNDHNGVAIEFSATDLEDALAVRDTKKIIKY